MSSFDINITGLDVVKNNIEKFKNLAEKTVEESLDTFGLNTVADAKINAPVDEGFLRNSITYGRKNVNGKYEVDVIVAASYAPYLEWGTRGFAERYVSSLPAEWQEFAEQFKGGSGGTFAELVARITEWVMRKGIAAETTKSGNRSKSASSLNAEKQAAYLIARKIVRQGIPAHPFLYPAVEKNKDELTKELKELFQ